MTIQTWIENPSVGTVVPALRNMVETAKQAREDMDAN